MRGETLTAAAVRLHSQAFIDVATRNGKKLSETVFLSVFKSVNRGWPRGCLDTLNKTRNPQRTPKRSGLYHKNDASSSVRIHCDEAITVARHDLSLFAFYLLSTESRFRQPSSASGERLSSRGFLLCASRARPLHRLIRFVSWCSPRAARM